MTKGTMQVTGIVMIVLLSTAIHKLTGCHFGWTLLAVWTTTWLFYAKP